MNNLFEKAEASRSFIQNTLGPIKLDSAIITGTGLGEIWKDLSIIYKIPYSDIPHFKINTVQSHSGTLYLCEYQNKNIAIFSGRFHYYEGFDADVVAFPVRVIKALGIDRILLTNVAGGLNEEYEPGSIVAITDHINWHPGHVLRGKNDERFGLRFPDMLYTYDNETYDELIKVSSNITPIHKGVYLVLQGPSLETPAEYNAVKIMGADLVGMSTVPEVIAAAHMNMRISALSVVSNICYPIESISETTIEEVIEVANKTIPKLNDVIKNWIVL